MSDLLTRVEILFLPESINYWVRFGDPEDWRATDRRQSFAYFSPGDVFGYVRWEANEYGTQSWRIWIVQAGSDVFPLYRIPGVVPGGEILLDLRGASRVKRALEQIDRLEAEGYDPGRVSPAYYLHIHNRILTRLPIRAYPRAQHEAHLAAMRVAA